MSDSEVKLFYAQNSEVSKRILAPDEHLRAIDTGAYYVAGPDGKPQAVLTASTSAQGVDLLDPRDGSVLTPSDLGWDVGGGGGSPTMVFAKDFPGVDRTGATDSTDAINAALAALPENSVVYFHPGTYIAAIRMVVPGMTLTGTWGAEIKTPSGATSHVNDACVRILADNCTVEKLKLNGNKAGNPGIDDSNLGRQSDGVGIYANRATVRGCRIYDTIGHKIIVWNQAFAPTGTAKGARSYFTFEGNHVTGFSWRASIDVASTDVTAPVNNNGIIRGNFVDGNMMIVHTGYDLLFEGNVILSTSGQEGGLSVHTNSKRVVCRDNIIGPGSLGLATSNNCEAIEFSGNKLYNITGAAILLSYGTGLVAKDNMIHTTGSGSAGVQCISVDGGAVCDNTIISAGGRSVYTTSSCANIKIDGNMSINPSTFHFECANTTYATVERNKCVGGPQGLVVTSGTNTGIVCTGNDFKGTSGTAINVTTPDAVITDNVIRNAGSHGIRISGQGSLVKDNEIRDITGNGINILAAVTGVVITDNRISNTSATPITGIQADTIVRRNSGYTTESMGSATIADTASTIVVTHGLRATPNVVTATPRGNENVWVSARTSTNFTISRTGTSGALNVDWRAEI